MNGRINEKIEEIETFLSELSSLLPANIQEYEKDFGKKAACERYFEKIVEAVVDAAFLLIKMLKLKIPEEDKEAFIILENKEIIPPHLSKRLQEAKSMRNILAHEYGIVDDAIVFHAVTEELENDVREFIENVATYFKKRKQEESSNEK